MAQPTLADILGYGADSTAGGQNEMMEYLTELLYKSSGAEGGAETMPELSPSSLGLQWWQHGDLGQEDIFSKHILGMQGQYGKDITQLSSEEMEKYLGGVEWNVRKRGGQHKDDKVFTTPETRGFSEKDIASLLSSFQGIQEGFKATPTAESWGLGEKIGGIEEGTKRDVKSAYEGYIPGEIMSRYGVLQGTESPAEFEASEAEYESDIYGLQRRAGRKTRGVYKEFEEDWFGGLENWIAKIGK